MARITATMTIRKFLDMSMTFILAAEGESDRSRLQLARQSANGVNAPD
jgi:hypothetical protein